MRRLMIVLSLAVLPISLMAQGRGAGGMRAPVAAPRAAMAPQGARVAGRAAPGVARVGAHVGARPVRPGAPVGTPIRRAHSGQFANRGAQSSDYYPVPGLGFDVTHVAATRGNRAAGFHHRDGRGSRFGAGGYVLYPVTGYVDGSDYADGTDNSVAEDAPPDQGAPDQQDYDAQEQEYPYVVDRQRQITRHPEPPSAEPAPQEPVHEMQQYVFVKKDGTVFFAVGYMWDKGNLQYVTQEGLRHSVASDALDLGATQKFNEQRGMSFRSPA